MAAVSGTVKDSNNAYAARIVRVYRRESGAYVGGALSDGTTGAWSVTTADTKEHFAIVHDVIGDASFSSVGLLLHGDGTNGSTTITDSSTGGKTVTVYGNAQISTAQSKFGGASILLDGSGDYLSLASSADFNFGSGDFTWECWLRRHAVVDATYADTLWCSAVNPVGLAIGINPTGHIGISADSTAGGAWDIHKGCDPGDPYGTAALSLDTWYHVAICRSGSNWYGFVDGALDQSFTSSATISDGGGGYFVGHWHEGNTRYLNGNIEELRITKGVARYTAAFPAPVAPFPNNSTQGSGNAIIYDRLVPA